MASNTDVYENMEFSNENSVASKHLNIEEAFNAPLPDDTTIGNRRDNLFTLNEENNKLLNSISNKNSEISFNDNTDMSVAMDDKNNWVQVCGSRRKRPHNPPAATTTPVSTTNTFAPLENDPKAVAKKVKIAPKVFPVDIILTPQLPYAELYKIFKTLLEFRPTV